MQIAATTSQAALTASPRLSATIPKETAPSAATAAHKSFVCSVFELLSLTLIASSRTAAKDKHNSHADDIDQVQSCQNATYAPQQTAPRRSPRRRIASSFDGTSDRVPWRTSRRSGAGFGTSWQTVRPLCTLTHRSGTPSLRVDEVSTGCAIGGVPSGAGAALFEC